MNSVLSFPCIIRFSASPVCSLFLPNQPDIHRTERADQEPKAANMGKTESFKGEFTFEERLEESRDMIAKYPDRVPVVVERYCKTDLPEMEKKKYLVPRDMSVGQLIHVLSSRLHLTPGKALFVFVQNTLPQTAALMESVYESYKEEDGFLYMCYSSEKTFGYSDGILTREL